MKYDRSLEVLISSGFEFAEWSTLYPGKKIQEIQEICFDYKQSLYRTVSRGGVLLASPATSKNYNYAWPGYRFIPHNLDFNICLPNSHPERQRFYYIFIMGGSAVHGCYLDDSSTIPARLQELLSDTRYNRKPVRVFNFSANNWTLENMFNFFRTLVLQGFVPDKVLALYGVNDPKNMSWSCDISVYLDNLYKKSVGRDPATAYPHFDFPYFDDKDHSEVDCHSFNHSWLETQLNKKPIIMKTFCKHVEATNRAFQKFCSSLNVQYRSWLQPVPSYLSEKLYSQSFCKQSLGLNRYAIVRIVDFYHLTSELYPHRLAVASQLSDELKYLDFCHYSEPACSRIAQFLVSGSFLTSFTHRLKHSVKKLMPLRKVQHLSQPVISPNNIHSPAKFSSDTNYPLY